MLFVLCKLWHRALDILSSWFFVSFIKLVFSKYRSILVSVIGSFHGRAVFSSGFHFMARINGLQAFSRIQHSSRKWRIVAGSSTQGLTQLSDYKYVNCPRVLLSSICSSNTISVTKWDLYYKFHIYDKWLSLEFYTLIHVDSLIILCH